MSEAELKNPPLKEGNYAPDFTVDIVGGKSFTLSENRNHNIVLYFYPKDDTPGCTNEAKDFSALIKDFNAQDTIIIGISRDSIEKHQKFIDKHNLKVILGSDEQGSVCEAYNTWVEKNMYGKKYMGIQRDTYLIDTKGVIKKIWRKVKVSGHAEAVLDAVR